MILPIPILMDTAHMWTNKKESLKWCSLRTRWVFRRNFQLFSSTAHKTHEMVTKNPSEVSIIIKDRVRYVFAHCFYASLIFTELVNIVATRNKYATHIEKFMNDNIRTIRIISQRSFQMAENSRQKIAFNCNYCSVNCIVVMFVCDHTDV